MFVQHKMRASTVNEMFLSELDGYAPALAHQFPDLSSEAAETMWGISTDCRCLRQITVK